MSCQAAISHAKTTVSSQEATNQMCVLSLEASFDAFWLQEEREDP